MKTFKEYVEINETKKTLEALVSSIITKLPDAVLKDKKSLRSYFPRAHKGFLAGFETPDELYEDEGDFQKWGSKFLKDAGCEVVEGDRKQVYFTKDGKKYKLFYLAYRSVFGVIEAK